MDLIFRLAEEFLKKHKRLARYRRVFALLAAVVVFATTYELILPAITMDKKRALAEPGVEVGVASDRLGGLEASDDLFGESTVSEEALGAEFPAEGDASLWEPAGDDGTGGAVPGTDGSDTGTAGVDGFGTGTFDGGSSADPSGADGNSSAGTWTEEPAATDGGAFAGNGSGTNTSGDDSLEGGAADPADSTAADPFDGTAAGGDLFDGQQSGEGSYTDGQPAGEADSGTGPGEAADTENNTDTEGIEAGLSGSEPADGSAAPASGTSAGEAFDADAAQEGPSGSDSLAADPSAFDQIVTDPGEFSGENTGAGSADENANTGRTDDSSNAASGNGGTANAASAGATGQTVPGSTDAAAIAATSGSQTLPATLTYEGKDYTVTATFDEKAALPEGVTLQAVEILPDTEYKDEKGAPLYPDYEEYYEKTLETLEKEKRLADDQTVTTARFFDITFLDKDGLTVEPKAPVNIAVQYKDALPAAETADTMAVHFDVDEKKDKTEVEVIETKTEVETVRDTKTKEKKEEISQISFDAEKFSVYGVIGTQVITTRVMTAGGDTYEITVTYGPEAEIPANAKLDVREIPAGTEEFESYKLQTGNALAQEEDADALSGGETAAAEEENPAGAEEEPEPGMISYPVQEAVSPEISFLRLFDITIMRGEKKIEPKAPVEVTITYVEPVGTEDGSSLDVIHFADTGAEIIEDVSVSEDGKQIVYQAESFSVYGTAESDVGQGDYIIYRDSAEYALKWNAGRQKISISNGRVTSESDEVVWTFTPVSGGYKIRYTSGGRTYYLYASGNNSISTTTTQDSASVWSYDNNHHLSTTYDKQTRYLRYDDNQFKLGGSNSSGRTIYLARVLEPAEITIHYVDESGKELKDSAKLGKSTSTGVTAIEDIVEAISGYTYHNTYLTSTSGTRIVPELRGAGGGEWEYQVYGQEAYTRVSGDTDIYVVYGDAYGSDGSGDGSGDGDTPEIGIPETSKKVEPNQDGTFTLSLSITGEGETGDDSRGANVVLILDTSNSMNTNVSGGGTRFSNAVIAAQNVSSSLLSLNTEKYPELVEMCLVEFNWDVTTSGWYTQAGSANAQGIYPEGTFNRKIADSARNSGTNWEGALQGAIAAANGHKDGDDTYIIFLTDGNPSAYTGTKDGKGRYENEANTDTSSGDYYRISKNYMHATDEARQIVQNGWNFYSIGMYGNVDVLKYLTNFAYTGRSDGDQQGYSGHYYPAAETAALIAALNDIADVISNSLALAGVTFHDGVAKDVTHTALGTAVNGRLGGLTYSKEGGTGTGYTVTVDADGKVTFLFGSDPVDGGVINKEYDKLVEKDGKVTTETATAEVYAADYGGKTHYMPIASYSAAGDFQWDLSPLGTLEKNATYTVSFEVWPDQDAYDYVTNLNNGIAGYTWDEEAQQAVYAADETTVLYYRNGVARYPNIVKYPDGSFAAMSNTYQSVDYYIANTEESGGTSTTSYEKGKPIDLDVPDPMILTGSHFEVTKKWEDSLDPQWQQSMIDQGIGITLQLFEDGVHYKDYTFKPELDEETGEYVWPSRTVNIAPALLTSHYPGGGTYKTVTIGGTTYYVLNEGHQYVLKETETDDHFEFNTVTYHPALINNVLHNVKFQLNAEGEIVDQSTGTVVGDVPLSTFLGTNTLRGGLNIYKKVVDKDNKDITDNSDTFAIKVTLTAPKDEDGQPDLSHVEPFYEYVDGERVDTGRRVAWFRYVDSKGKYVNKLPGDPNDPLAFIPDDAPYYDSGSFFFLEFNRETGIAENTIPITDDYSIRFVNLPADMTYSVLETGTCGMQPSYSHWHENSDSEEQIIIGNASSNIRITNKCLSQRLKIKKIGSDAPNGLAGAVFALAGNQVEDFTDLTDLTTGADGLAVLTEEKDGTTVKTTIFDLPFGNYSLTETGTPQYYTGLTGPVTLAVSAQGMTASTAEGDGGLVTLTGPDSGGIYTLTVTNNRRLATVTVIKNVTGTDADKDSQYDFTVTGLTEEADTFKLYGRHKDEEGQTPEQVNSRIYRQVPYGTVFSVKETVTEEFDTTIAVTGLTDPITGTETGNLTVTGDMTVTYTNTRNRQLVSVWKTGLSYDTLTGADFALYRAADYDDDAGKPKDGAEAIMTGTVGTKGLLPLNKLAVGEYRLVETQAPAGYNLLTSAIRITVRPDAVTAMQAGVDAEVDRKGDASGHWVSGQDESTWQIRVWNNPGAVLPRTGGSGKPPYILSGILLAMASALLYIFRMRRRERRSF